MPAAENLEISVKLAKNDLDSLELFNLRVRNKKMTEHGFWALLVFEIGSRICGRSEIGSFKGCVRDKWC
jgi:hypothetical protein